VVLDLVVVGLVVVGVVVVEVEEGVVPGGLAVATWGLVAGKGKLELGHQSLTLSRKGRVWVWFRNAG
jgi:hypothetical protein